MQPVRVIFFLAEPERPFQEPGGYFLRVLRIGIALVGRLGRWSSVTSRAARGRGTTGLLVSGRSAVSAPGWLRGGAGRRDARKGIVGHQLIACGGERSAGRSGNPDTHDVPPQTPAPLG